MYGFTVRIFTHHQVEGEEKKEFHFEDRGYSNITDMTEGLTELLKNPYPTIFINSEKVPTNDELLGRIMKSHHEE
jgi:hypothetical protein